MEGDLLIMFKRKFRLYKYYLPLFFATLLFVFILILILPNQGRTKCTIENLDSDKNCLKDLSPLVKNSLIFDKNVAKVASASPLIIATAYSDDNKDTEVQNFEVKEVIIPKAYKEVVVITDPKTLIVFKNETGEQLDLRGVNNGWGASILSNEGYSQLFEKPGKYEFTINDKPVGVVRVR